MELQALNQLVLRQIMSKVIKYHQINKAKLEVVLTGMKVIQNKQVADNLDRLLLAHNIDKRKPIS